VTDEHLSRHVGHPGLSRVVQDIVAERTLSAAKPRAAIARTFGYRSRREPRAGDRADVPGRSPRPDIELLLTRPAWMARGACRGAGSEIFFPERGESLEPARAYCDRCPVREECASYALEISREGLLPGVWAGTSERTRRQLRRTPA
jgi:WhiB family redox-sensing transcriptional regulator